MPRVEWNEKNSKYVYCFFPFVGLISGLIMFLWLFVSYYLGFGQILRAAVFMLIPVLVSGGLHMDGFCDVSDAFASHQEPKKMLEIMKDTHAGAFAIIRCVLYFIITFALWCEVILTWKSVVIAGLSLIISRSLSGFAAVTRKNARGSGMLAAFSEPADKKKVSLILIIWMSLSAIAAILLSPIVGGLTVIACGLTFLYYTYMTHRKFGGITGDLAGWFVQVCETIALLAIVLGQKIAIILM